MNKISVRCESKISTTTIPNVFFDRYMPAANGEFLKVYLYLFRWSQESSPDLSLSSIADIFNMTENDVKRALRYWEKENLLSIGSLSNGEIDSIQLHNFDVQTVISEPEIKDPLPQAPGSFTPDKTMAKTAPPKPAYSMQRVQEFSDDYDGDQLFFVIQQYLGKPLGQTDINTIVYFHEQLGLTVDLIEYLFEYCVSNNHRSMKYIEKVALSWVEQGIDTIAKAKANCTYYHKSFFAVLKAFGISGRNPIDSEIAYIKRWQNDYCFSMPVILEACKRTMLATHTASYEYTDTILKNWKNKNVTNLDDIKALDLEREKKKKSTVRAVSASAATNNKFHNFNQRSYDYEDLEKKLTQKLQTTAPKGS